MKTTLVLAIIAASVAMALAPGVVALAKVQTVADAQLRACIEQEHRSGTLCAAAENGGPRVGHK